MHFSSWLLSNQRDSIAARVAKQSSTKTSMMKIYQLFLVGAFTVSTLIGNAQSLSPAVISTAGGHMQNSQVSMDWTLGEAAVSRWKTPQGFVTEGFHQPVLEVSLLPQYETAMISIAPNPVQSTLNVQIKELSKHSLFANLVDIQGRVLIPLTSLQLGSTEFDMSNLPAGMYFLNVSRQNGKSLEVYKVVKTN